MSAKLPPGPFSKSTVPLDNLGLCCCLQLLVEKGADVNRAFTPESLPAIPFKQLVTQCPTALHLACDRGDVDLVKVSLQLSAQKWTPVAFTPSSFSWCKYCWQSCGAAYHVCVRTGALVL